MLPMMTGGVGHMDPYAAAVEQGKEAWVILRKLLVSSPGDTAAEGIASMHTHDAREEAAIKVSQSEPGYPRRAQLWSMCSLSACV